MRLTNPGARREAITSRPWLMSSVGCRTEHAGQTTLMCVSALLQGWVAEQLGGAGVWQRGGRPSLSPASPHHHRSVCLESCKRNRVTAVFRMIELSTKVAVFRRMPLGKAGSSFL